MLKPGKLYKIKSTYLAELHKFSTLKTARYLAQAGGSAADIVTVALVADDILFFLKREEHTGYQERSDPDVPSYKLYFIHRDRIISTVVGESVAHIFYEVSGAKTQ